MYKILFKNGFNLYNTCTSIVYENNFNLKIKNYFKSEVMKSNNQKQKKHNIQ